MRDLLLLIEHEQAVAAACDALVLFVVYDHPTDYPANVVVRAWHTGSWGTAPSDYCCVLDDLETVRRVFGGKCEPTLSFVRVEPEPDDDPKIAEVWL